MVISTDASSSSNTVTLPPSLAFLVSNFHSLVNIRLHGTNYLLWRVQVENVTVANGFYEYLEGIVVCPPSTVRNNEGLVSPNHEFLKWTLIDTQLLACLTATLSQSTLPYVLGLRHVHQVWESLSNRYNSISKNHVQDLKRRMYSLVKTSTMEAYIDTVKEYAQKLQVTGSPMSDEDLIFHLLRGLPKMFDSFKTAIRTRGSDITFDEVVTMLNSEDLQLIQEGASEYEISTVLVATTHGNTNHGVQNMRNSNFQSQMQIPVSSQIGMSQSS